MSFRLVPKSVTLNDFERRNTPNGCLISIAFWADCVKVVKIHGCFLRQKCRPKNGTKIGDLERPLHCVISLNL